MRVVAHNAYMALKDELFDLEHGGGAVGKAAGWLLARLPVTRTERELCELLFG